MCISRANQLTPSVGGVPLSSTVGNDDGTDIRDNAPHFPLGCMDRTAPLLPPFLAPLENTHIMYTQLST